MIFRFDDISANSIKQVGDILKMGEYIQKKGGISIVCISWLSHKSEKKTGRVFPSSIKPLSDYREFYKVDQSLKLAKMGGLIPASHGLIHVDHRLLHRSAQEMSILVSCSLVGAKIFVPPFNKWNKDTEDICKENGIELIKYEDGWRSCEHNKFDPSHDKWYLHPYAWTPQKFKAWLG